jgi:hypothetical protein
MENVKENEVIDTLIDIEPEPATPMTGVVNATRLNIRESPSINAKIVAVVPVFTELLIDSDQADDEWYSVCTASGIEGFCMKEFVVIQQ